MKRSIERLGEYKFALTVIVIIIVIIIIVAGKFIFSATTKNENIENFDDCAAAGNAVMESYPRQCHANGQTYTEVIN